MTRKELLKKSIELCDRLCRRYDSLPPLESLRAQLVYLLNLEEGTVQDRSKLGQLSIGIIAAREIEDRDPELADLLYQLMEELGV